MPPSSHNSAPSVPKITDQDRLNPLVLCTTTHCLCRFPIFPLVELHFEFHFVFNTVSSSWWTSTWESTPTADQHPAFRNWKQCLFPFELQFHSHRRFVRDSGPSSANPSSVEPLQSTIHHLYALISSSLVCCRLLLFSIFPKGFCVPYARNSETSTMLTKERSSFKVSRWTEEKVRNIPLSHHASKRPRRPTSEGLTG